MTRGGRGYFSIRKRITLGLSKTWGTGMGARSRMALMRKIDPLIFLCVASVISTQPSVGVEVAGHDIFGPKFEVVVAEQAELVDTAWP